MSIIIMFACLLGGLIAGIAVAKAMNVLRPGKAVAVGAITGIVLAAVAAALVGGLAAGAALVGAVVGSIAYFFLQAAIIGGC